MGISANHIKMATTQKIGPQGVHVSLARLYRRPTRRLKFETRCFKRKQTRKKCLRLVLGGRSL